MHRKVFWKCWDGTSSASGNIKSQHISTRKALWECRHLPGRSFIPHIHDLHPKLSACSYCILSATVNKISTFTKKVPKWQDFHSDPWNKTLQWSLLLLKTYYHTRFILTSHLGYLLECVWECFHGLHLNILVVFISKGNIIFIYYDWTKHLNEQAVFSELLFLTWHNCSESLSTSSCFTFPPL